MLDFLNRHFMQPLAAAKAGSSHLRFLKLLRQTQFDSPEVVRARQLVALKAILHHAYATVPYYRKSWSEARVHPNDVHELADLENFPVVTKTDLRVRETEFLSDAYRGQKLLVVQPLLADGRTPDTDPVIAVDAVGAGRGEVVMITSDGRYVREITKDDATPLRWSIIGIKDA